MRALLQLGWWKLPELEPPLPPPWGEGGSCCQGWASRSGFPGYFGCQGLLVSPGQLRGGEGAGPAGSLRGAGLRPLGPNSPTPLVTTVNPGDPQTSIFHLTVPPGPPGSEVPLSPAQLHRGHRAPSPQPRIRAVPAPGCPRAQLWPLVKTGGAPGRPLAVSPGHHSAAASCPLAPGPSREPPTGPPCVAEVPAHTVPSGMPC